MRQQETVPMYLVRDWDDAYANGAHIAGADAWPAKWAAAAAAFREEWSGLGRAHLDLAYGPKPRNLMDLFLPSGPAAGLFVYIHGGYWKAFDKSYWSHFARGALSHGYAVALPSYTLCPEARLDEIAREMAAAVDHAMGRVDGPVVLGGHSAGGQQATRLATTTSPLSAGCRARIARIVSISGVHDLRPLRRTAMNATLQISETLAENESPTLLTPQENTQLICWVGAEERPEFRRQSALLPNIWAGLGAQTQNVEEPGKHHFNIIDGLLDAGHSLALAVAGRTPSASPS